MAADGESVLYLQSSGGADPVNSLWQIRRGAAAPELLFDAAPAETGELTDAERARRERAREQAAGVVAFVVGGEHGRAHFVLGGGLHRVDVDTGAVEVMAADDVVFDPRPEPTGSRVAYVSGSSLRVTDGENDRELVADGDPLVSWGAPEFVAAEEMGRSRGFWWDPAGGRMLATRVDVGVVDEWWIASPDDPSAAPRAIRYPGAGTANASVELWLVDADTGPVRSIDWQRGEFEYLADVRWTDRGLFCVVQPRSQRSTVVLRVDPDSGEATEVFRDEDGHWVELIPGAPTWRGDALVTVVDDGAARRLMVDGTPLTGDDLQVRSIVGVDGEDVLVTAATEPKNSVVLRVAADGTMTELTGRDGYATAAFGGGTIVVGQARADDATVHEVRWHDGSRSEIVSKADAPGFACTPSFAILGPRRLEAALLLPNGHDGSPLPVLMDPYGGPHAQRVLRVRNGYATSQWFAEQGFAVVVVDGRGTPGRGPAFEREVWGDLAQPVLDDQVDALQALAAERPELDLGRVGIRGWSFGGYLAALAVLRRPDVFHAAVAGAPVTEWRLYDTHYTERYLGHPDAHAEHYDRSSLLPDAGALERELMLIHGLADDNVVAAHTLVLSRALLEAGRPHTVLPLSGVTHMTPQEQVAENLLHLQRDFLLDALG